MGKKGGSGEAVKGNWGKGKTDPVSWWQKGQPSPNPKGRPKGRKNNKTLYKEAFAAKVPVKIDGKSVKLTKDELSYHNFASKCAAGDLKALHLKLQYDEKFAEPEPVSISAEDHAFDLASLDELIALRRRYGSPEEGAQ